MSECVFIQHALIFGALFEYSFNSFMRAACALNFQSHQFSEIFTKARLGLGGGSLLLGFVCLFCKQVMIFRS